MRSEPIRLALLGRPVAHSRSPAIHRAAMKEAGLTGDYVAVEAGEAELDQAIADLRAGRLNGANVTMPLKAAAAERSDDMTPMAVRAASVNSLRAREGRVEAHSTDAVAFHDIFQGGLFPRPSTVLVLGSGGSARAALAAVGDQPVYVSSRDPNRAEELEAEFGIAGAVPWHTAVAGAVVVNATPLGMGGEGLPEGVLEVAAGLVDLPYGPTVTPAAGYAAAEGMPLVDGIEFLARQAAASFEWWTGVAVDYEALAHVARNV